MEGMVGREGEARNSTGLPARTPLAGSVLLAVAAGGALGAVLRVLVGLWVVSLLRTAIPWGTLGVNVAGSLALGWMDVRLPRDPHALLRAFAIPGFCGGFTTFSAFGVESVLLLEAGRTGAALGYVGGSVVVCVAGVVAGSRFGRRPNGRARSVGP